MSMMLTSVLLLASAAVNLAVGTIVMASKPHDPKNQSFFIFALGAALWVGCFGLLILTHESAFISMLNVGGAVLLLGVYVLAMIFRGIPIRGLALISLLPFSVAIAVAAYPSFLVTSVTYGESCVTPVQGWVFPYYAAWFIAYLGAALALMVGAYRRAPIHEHKQIQYLFLGVGGFALIGTVCDVILPAIGIFSLNAAGPGASIIFVGATGYAIACHRLMDIRLIIERGAVYSTILLTVLATFVLGLAVTTHLLHRLTAVPVFILICLALTVGVLGSRSIERRVGHVVRPLLFEHDTTAGTRTGAAVETARLGYSPDRPATAGG